LSGDTAPLIAGVDEVGRGALFGPVVAAAVVVPLAALSRLSEFGVRDSKRLAPERRRQLDARVRELAVEVRVAYATVEEIDRLNILRATLLAMGRAVRKLSVVPSLCLVDGQYTLDDLSIEQEAMVRGDERSPAIAAASIVAKVWRDDLIVRWSGRYPDHGLDRHKGYGTEGHRRAIREFGVTPQHRLSFRPCRAIVPDRR
jgi:ribonuclease HII